MATVITLDDDVQAKVDSMVRAGRFASPEDAIQTALTRGTTPPSAD